MGSEMCIRDSISHGADVNVREKYGETPLMYASFMGHAKVVEALLDAGADKELKATSGDWEGKTALDLARSQNKGDVVAILELSAAGAKPKLSAEEQKKKPEKTQNQALYDAASYGEMGKLEAAIAAGAEVDWHNPDRVSKLSELE